MKKIFSAASLALFLAFVSMPAHAAISPIVSITGIDFAGGYVYDDTWAVPGTFGSATLEGSLAANSLLTFDFSLTGVDQLFYASANATALSTGGFDFVNSGMPKLDGTTDGGLVTLHLVTSSLSNYMGDVSGRVTITNLLKEAIDISLALQGVFLGTGTFHVLAQVSSVPLPAALPLFGLGLASLIGYRARKKKQLEA